MKTIGVIGLGSIGMRHANNLLAMGHEVVAYDPDIAYANGIKMLPRGMAISSSIVVIASPTNYHFYDVIEATAIGAKVFAEKPIADRYDARLRNIAMLGCNLRFHSCVKKALEWLPQIGEPIWANFTCAQYNAKPAYLRDGVILNWGAHEIDLALHLLGPAEVAASTTRLTDGHDDMTDIVLAHKSGCRTTIHLDYVTDPERRGFTIVGTKGRIAANLVSRIARLKVNGMKDQFKGSDSFDENYIEEMQTFLTLVDNPSIKTIGCTGEEGLEVLKICLEVRRQAGL